MNQQKLTFRTFFFFKTLPLQSASAPTLRDLSLHLSIETPALNTPYAATQSHFHKTMYFESGEKPSACQPRSFCGHIVRFSVDWWPRTESEWANGHRSSRRSSGKSTANIYWEVWKDTITMVYYWSTTMERAKKDLSFERAFSNYSSVQRIILFKCGTSHKIKMVTSLWHHRVFHPCGLMKNLLGLRCQFCGDWSQRIASLTSESDSYTFASEETQHHYSFSLTTNMNRISLRIHEYVPVAKQETYFGPEVGVYYFYIWHFGNSFSSPGNGFSERRWSMANVGVHSYISTKASSTSSEHRIIGIQVPPALSSSFHFNHLHHLRFTRESLLQLNLCRW